ERVPLCGFQAPEYRAGNEPRWLAVRLLLPPLPLRVRLRADQQQVLAVTRATQHVQHGLQLRAVRAERAALELARQVEARRVDGEHARAARLLAVHARRRH